MVLLSLSLLYTLRFYLIYIPHITISYKNFNGLFSKVGKFFVLNGDFVPFEIHFVMSVQC